MTYHDLPMLARRADAAADVVGMPARSSEGRVHVTGRIEGGVGKASEHVGAAAEELQLLLGERIFPGSLNVRLEKPVALDRAAAIRFDGNRLLWPATINGTPVWLYRWLHAPLHVAEILSADHLRDKLGLSDGERVTIDIDRKLLARTPSLAWSILWKGREGWYRRSGYNELINRIGRATWFGLEGSPAAVAKRTMSAFGLARPPRSPFRRIEARSEHQKLLNILNYTKTSGSSYSADRHPAGYHSIELDGRVLRGQRDPQARLAQVPIDWAGKSVLDIGSNQGGMLFALADKLKWGVGIDYDSRLVNAANRIRRSKGVRQLDFFVFNLEQEQLDLVRDLLPEDRVDVCFLLSVCMWIENWREVIDFAASIADTVLFETNGARQDEQIAYLRSVCRKVDILAERSTDDPNQQDRKLLLCTVR